MLVIGAYLTQPIAPGFSGLPFSARKESDIDVLTAGRARCALLGNIAQIYDYVTARYL
jgi:hypothetical protein